MSMKIDKSGNDEATVDLTRLGQLLSLLRLTGGLMLQRDDAQLGPLGAAHDRNWQWSADRPLGEEPQ